MKLLQFPIILFCSCFIIGIATHQWLDLNIIWVIWGSAGLLGVFIALYLANINRINKTIGFGLISALLMIGTGILVHHFHQPIHNKAHYTHHINPDTPLQFILEIRDVLKPNLYNDRYYAKVLKINNQPVKGKLLLNISRDSTTYTLNVGEIIVITTTPQELPVIKNPHQFDYKSYLERHYIYIQINTEISQFLHTHNDIKSIPYYAAKLRNNAIKQLELYGLEGDELAVVKALLLGQRQDLSEDIQNNFASAGAIHILAISGLHIGIILYMLNWMLQPLARIKHGKVVKTVILVLLLWSYAIVAGLSPSVVRAVTMFTAVAIAINLKRANNIYNTLAVSAFVLLLFKPNFLFEVGFQMSYSAVIGIVSIQPVIFKLWSTRLWVPKKIWEILTVTIAAQASVLPISIYYFHQFPSLFFISNLVIIPFLGVILGFGFFVLIFASVDWMHNWIVNLYAHIISWLNQFIEWIASFESFLIKDIPLSIIELITLFFLIATLVRLIEQQTTRRLIWTLTSIVIFQLAYLITIKNTATTEMVVFHKTAESILGIKTGTHLDLYSDADSLNLSQHFIETYKVGNRIKTIESLQLNPVLQYENKLVLVVDSLGIYNVNFKPDVVILRNSPKINLVRLIDKLNPEQIVADGSNYVSYVARWQDTCTKKRIPFHSTRKTGFYMMKK